MLSFLVTLFLLSIGFPRKSTRQQDSRIVIAYVSLAVISLILAVLHVTETTYILTNVLQNIMNSIAEKVGG
ncbi:hypothetical protein A8709_02290 [Paenibacillus pectinilyticus]|uniref:Uncharacterized protein n=2 Tax=Paenibacillus pectinilyticus TaxID=512399 RepID=A0A1C1A6V2_9BACL|nr:hypothetical protein A8709_02290 [Paenibacillus pectinilyticus]